MGGIDGIRELWNFMTHEENCHHNFELLKAYIEEHHHLPDKKKVENRDYSFARHKCLV